MWCMLRRPELRSAHVSSMFPRFVSSRFVPHVICTLCNPVDTTHNYRRWRFVFCSCRSSVCQWRSSSQVLKLHLPRLDQGSFFRERDWFCLLTTRMEHVRDVLRRENNSTSYFSIFFIPLRFILLHFASVPTSALHASRAFGLHYCTCTLSI